MAQSYVILMTDHEGDPSISCTAMLGNLSPRAIALTGLILTLAPTGLLSVASLLSLTSCVAALGDGELGGSLWGDGLSARDRVVLFVIRQPRLERGIAVGAAVAVMHVLP